MTIAPDVELLPGFLGLAEAEETMAELLRTCPLRVERTTLYGRPVALPRETAWHGDPWCVYRYSGMTFSPDPWTERLSALRAKVEAAVGAPFNGVLLNHYRDGQDTVGWHADDEPCFGSDPIIASLSLGHPRRFVMKHRASGEKVEWLLGDGCLLVMRGDSQRSWLHAVPRTRQPVGPRLNLTWRRVL